MLREVSEPNVMLSYGTRDSHPWDGIESLTVDSGGYSLLARGEAEYPGPVVDYLDYVDESGADYYMTRDVPCADRVLRNLEGGKNEAIARTVELTETTLEAHRRRDLGAEPVAVLQGAQPRDYVSCYHQLVERELVTERLAIGSLKGLTTRQTVDVITSVRDAVDADSHDVELHGLGVEAPALEHEPVRNALAAADSSRYISTARWRANRDETPPRLRDDEPRSGWYEVLRAYLDMRAELREALDGDADTDAAAPAPTRSRQATLGD